MTPAEIAFAFRAHRVRTNARIRERAWMISWLLAVHVASKDSAKIQASRIALSAPQYDNDLDLD